MSGRLLRRTLANRLEGSNFVKRPDKVLRIVEKWLDALAVQAEKDGATVAPDVFEKTAQKLRERLI